MAQNVPRSLTQTASSDDHHDGRHPDAQPIRIVIADELPIFRDGLRLLLGTDARLQVVGGADVSPAADRLVHDFQPEILLLGYLSSATPAIQMLERLDSSGLSVRTILLVRSADAPDIVEALRIGARGVVARDSAADLLFKSIDAVMAGRYWIGRECAAGDALENVRRLERTPGDARFGLTRRELEMVRGIVNGETNREIAVRLAISENTVKRHIMNVFNKVGCSSRVELALFAAYHGLLQDA